jgi:hypothetical protein
MTANRCNTISRRDILRLGGTAVAGGLAGPALGSCSMAPAAGPASGGGTFTIYWSSNHVYDPYVRIVDQFQTDHGVTVNWQKFRWDDLQTKLPADFASGTVPDLVEQPSGTALIPLAKSGDALSLDPYVAQDGAAMGFPDDWQQSTVESWSHDGRFQAGSASPHAAQPVNPLTARPSTRACRLGCPSWWQRVSEQPVRAGASLFDLSPVVAATTQWLVRAYPGTGRALGVALAEAQAHQAVTVACRLRYPTDADAALLILLGPGGADQLDSVVGAAGDTADAWRSWVDEVAASWAACLLGDQALATAAVDALAAAGLADADYRRLTAPDERSRAAAALLRHPDLLAPVADLHRDDLLCRLAAAREAA